MSWEVSREAANGDWIVLCGAAACLVTGAWNFHPKSAIAGTRARALGQVLPGNLFWHWLVFHLTIICREIIPPQSTHAWWICPPMEGQLRTSQASLWWAPCLPRWKQLHLAHDFSSLMPVHMVWAAKATGWVTVTLTTLIAYFLDICEYFKITF